MDEIKELLPSAESATLLGSKPQPAFQRDATLFDPSFFHAIFAIRESECESTIEIMDFLLKIKVWNFSL